MQTYSTREAAKKLGISGVALGRYIKNGKVDPPEQIVKIGRKIIHAWTDDDIARLRKLLPNIRDGRKTRFQKKQAGPGSQPSAKPKAKKSKAKPATRKKN